MSALRTVAGFLERNLWGLKVPDGYVPNNKGRVGERRGKHLEASGFRKV